MHITPAIVTTLTPSNRQILSAPGARRLGWKGTAALAAAVGATLLCGSARAERSYEAWRAEPDAAGATLYQAADVAMDQQGNVITTGYVFEPGGFIEFYTAKHDGLNGRLLWEKRYNSGFGHSAAKAVAVDASGNVFVTGSSIGDGTDEDYCTIKYSGETGHQLWVRRFNNALVGGVDRPVALGVDASGGVVVTGSSAGFAGAQADYFTIKYTSSGDTAWSRRYNSEGNHEDFPTSLAVSPSGAVAVTGSSRVGANDCIYTVRYDEAGVKTWEKSHDGAAGKDDAGRAVAMDEDGNVIVSGKVPLADNTSSYYTIKYAAADGQKLWDQTFASGAELSVDVAGVAVDFEGNVIMAGSVRTDADNINFYTAKYDGENGEVLWETRSQAPDRLPGVIDRATDGAFDLALDGAGNAIVGGLSAVNGGFAEYYVAKLDGTDGATLFERRLDMTGKGGASLIRAVAADALGNFVVLGNSTKPSTDQFGRMPAVKFNRFLLSAGDRVRGGEFGESAAISGFDVPALSATGEVVAKVTVKDGTRLRSAIIQQPAGGGNYVVAQQGQQIPGLPGASFLSFGEPVISRVGRIAFTAKLAGVPATAATSLWTTVFNDDPQLILRSGQQVPGFEPGVRLKAIQSICPTEFGVNVLVTLSGPGVNAGNSTAFLRFGSADQAIPLLRTGNTVNADGVLSTIRKISIATPGKATAGHGRYHSFGNSVANLTLADGRTVVVRALAGGGLNAALSTGGNAGIIEAGAKWASFGLPAISLTTDRTAVIANVKRGGAITAANDTAILGSTDGFSYFLLTREGDEAPETGGAVFAGFADCLTNGFGRHAYLATLRGAGVTAANRQGLWAGSAGSAVLQARQGAAAPDVFGEPTGAVFSAFTSFALPGAVNSGPLFIAKLKGQGVTPKNNEGLWYRQLAGPARQLLRTGDTLDGRVIKKFITLNPAAGSPSVSRAFSNTAVLARVVFTDKTQAVVRLPLQ